MRRDWGLGMGRLRTSVDNGSSHSVEMQIQSLDALLGHSGKNQWMTTSSVDTSSLTTIHRPSLTALFLGGRIHYLGLIPVVLLAKKKREASLAF